MIVLRAPLIFIGALSLYVLVQRYVAFPLADVFQWLLAVYDAVVATALAPLRSFLEWFAANVHLSLATVRDLIALISAVTVSAALDVSFEAHAEATDTSVSGGVRISLAAELAFEMTLTAGGALLLHLFNEAFRLLLGF